MKPERIVQAIFNDLERVSSSKPNERLPKEEQLRCCLFSTFRSDFDVLCAEHGYCSIDDLSRTECDLWGYKPGKPPMWMEIKRCWAGKGWNNKPFEQRYSWQADISKLKEVPSDSVRYFLLVGFFNFDPTQEDKKSSDPILKNIYSFYESNCIYSNSKTFTWRKETKPDITHIAAWVWCWQSGQQITLKL